MVEATKGEIAVSVIIAAHRAHDTIGRAVASLLAQTMPSWEAVVVSDDGSDYAATLAGLGFDDPRIRHVSSGGVASGCGRPRNVGLAVARGAFVTRLDADDLFHPDRLAQLLPIAAATGAVSDDPLPVEEESGAALRRALADLDGSVAMAASELALLHLPLAPIVARDRAPPWFEDVGIGEDVLYLFAVEDAIGPITVVPEPLYEYRVRATSMCHGEDGADLADLSYASIDQRLAAGAFAQLSEAAAARARSVFAAKRAFNRAFGAARAAGFSGNFQDYRNAIAAGGVVPPGRDRV